MKDYSNKIKQQNHGNIPKFDDKVDATQINLCSASKELTSDVIYGKLNEQSNSRRNLIAGSKLVPPSRIVIGQRSKLNKYKLDFVGLSLIKKVDKCTMCAMGDDNQNDAKEINQFEHLISARSNTLILPDHNFQNESQSLLDKSFESF
ncbi:hypothetical protein GJ496_008604 [Pomphorhynchus laevis]|nr:hypothetical protein GJ496_008604 [Pomphorhynchus laevis]